MRFLHPFLTSGTVAQGDRSWPIVEGVLDAPEEVGRAQGWQKAPKVAGQPASPAEPPAPTDTAEPSGGEESPASPAEPSDPGSEPEPAPEPEPKSASQPPKRGARR